jgi:hypothetical protein
MNGIVYFAILGVVSASSKCTIHALVGTASAASDGTQAGMSIFAATQRCEHQGLRTQCFVDISSAIYSVNAMVNDIVEAIDECGLIGKNANKACAMEVGQLTKYTAGLATASGHVAQHCVQAEVTTTQPAHPMIPKQASDIISCSISTAGILKELLKAGLLMTQVSQNCHETKSAGGIKMCASNVFNIAAAVSGMGSFLSAAIGDCQKAAHAGAAINTRTEMCSEGISQLVAYSSKLADTGIQLTEKCTFSGSYLRNITSQCLQSSSVPLEKCIEDVKAAAGNVSRLYEAEGGETANQSRAMPFNMLLVALLPVTAIVCFAGGRFFGRGRVGDSIHCESRTLLHTSGVELTDRSEPGSAARLIKH